MNRYQDENWQQEEQRRREAYYRMNSQNSNTPDALEQIFRGPLNWMNLLMIGINVVIFIIMEFLGSTEDTGFMLQWGAACRPFILNGEWYRLFTSMFLHFGIYHLANNMAVLLFMGDMVENAVGHWKYLAIYLGSGLVGNLLSLYMDIQSQQHCQRRCFRGDLWNYRWSFCSDDQKQKAGERNSDPAAGVCHCGYDLLRFTGGAD